MVNVILSAIILWVFSWMFVLVDDFLTHVYYWVRKKLNGNQEIMTTSTNVFDDLKNSWIRNVYYKIANFFNHVRDFPVDLYDETKYFIQRGIRGYSDRDCWSIDLFLSNVLPIMLRQFRRNTHGCPILKGFKNIDTNYKEFKRMQKEWDRILANIIYTFDVAKKIQDNDWFYQPSQEYSESVASDRHAFHQRLIARRPENYRDDMFHVMTKEECQKYEKGWEYFQKYFFNLWD